MLRENFEQYKRDEKSREAQVYLTSRGHSTYLEYIDDQGQEVAEEEDSNNTEQHPGQTLFSGLAPDKPVYY